ncbi:MAG TPA: DUF2461 domain-containing protein [Saprospiraceae bacterium]|nr:DUF2461 domain-containing protein [Saprospiraceae bacterium]HMP22685.1 DUF2461 domain-containing protein [Saprospiraceae bacterium]
MEAAEKKAIFNFLKDLRDNNHKDWMDANRSRYDDAKTYWLKQVGQFLAVLSKHDPQLFSIYKPKNCISRITNNRMYKPDLPLYKDYFTFSIMNTSDAFSPIYVSVGADRSFVGCGYHNPDKQTLKNIRDAIDYDGQELKSILDDKIFQNFFGGLSDFSSPLKTSPKGYPKDHPFIEFLRYKSFTVSKTLTEAAIISDDFIEIIEQAYLISKPFRTFLKKANDFSS